MNVTAIMPVKGRTTETVNLIPRLLSTASYALQLIVVVDDDPDMARALVSFGDSITLINNTERRGYWRGMADGMQKATGELIANLANDLLPGRDWLARAVAAYEHRFGQGQGIIGFNDGVHPGTHAGHMLFSRDLLHDWYGDDYFPLAYFHLWGDTEIVQRAIELKLFAVAPWAVLYHDHPANGKLGDRVYEIGHSKLDQDRATFERRQAAGWR